MKTVIITGANGHLGAAVVAHFLENGYRVVATVLNAYMLSDLQTHPNLELEVVDLTQESSSADFVQSVIAKYDNIHAALLLVGGFAMGNIATTGMADIRKQIALNFETAYHVAKPVFAQMKKQEQGRIVFIGARPALEPAKGKDLIAYGLSKSMLLILANYLNEEAKGTNVVTTVVVPSTLDTPVNRKAMPDIDPSNWVTPAALADILEFVVSEKSTVLRETVLKVYHNA